MQIDGAPRRSLPGERVEAATGRRSSAEASLSVSRDAVRVTVAEASGIQID